jgi:hypothetical protein
MHARSCTVIAGFLAAFIAAIGAATPAHACSCPRTTAEAVIARSSVAFRGNVREAQVVDQGNAVRATVVVTEWIKSRGPAILSVETSNRPGMCGYPLRAGSSYRFAGSIDASGLMRVSMCSMVPLNLGR